MKDKIEGTSDGSSADYYKVPPESSQLQDLISHVDMNAQMGEIFRATYRYGRVSHSDKMRDIKKIIYYGEAEKKRLEGLEVEIDGVTKAAFCPTRSLHHPSCLAVLTEEACNCNSKVIDYVHKIYPKRKSTMKVKLNCITKPLDLNLSPEEYIIYATRLSSEERLNNETAPKLLKYLIEHKHWSPFEMVSIGIEITTSRAIAQQLLRHRSFSFQEFSQRYAEVTEMEPIEVRLQAEKNRQSSSDVVLDIEATQLVDEHLESCTVLYQHLLEQGVAKECARMVLPLTTQTTFIMHGTLRSWIHLFEQRCSPHAQKETQDIAYAAREQIAVVCPWTANALSWNSNWMG